MVIHLFTLSKSPLNDNERPGPGPVECSLYIMFEFRKIRTSYHRIFCTIVIKNRPISEINLMKVCRDRNRYLHLYIVKKIFDFATFFNGSMWLADILCYCYISHFLFSQSQFDWHYNKTQHKPIILSRRIKRQNSKEFLII